MSTVFFSWQSDLERKTNKNLIHRCLKLAATQINKNTGVDDAPRDQSPVRIDQDTKDVPGHPEIFQTILKKIENCDVFVPDFSLVAHTAEGKKCPNPNVMIEYGYALKILGAEKIIPVMNTAYGDFNDLPFDLRAKRAPVSFHLEENASAEKIKTEKEKLSKSLAQCFKSSLDKTNSEEKKNINPELAYHRYITPLDSKMTMELKDDNGGYLPLCGMFLLVFPNGSWNIKKTDFTKTVREKLRPFGRIQHGWSHTRWPDGVEIYEPYKFAEKEGDTEIRKNCSMLHYDDGVLVGFDRFNPYKVSGCKGILPSTYIEQEYTRSLQGYLSFYKEHTSFKAPFTIIVGLHNVYDFKLALPSGYIEKHSEENILNNSVLESLEVNDFGNDISTLLEPFFDKIWDEVSLERPQKINKAS